MFTVNLPTGEIDHKEYWTELWQAKAAAKRGWKADGVNRQVFTWPESRLLYDTALEPPAPEFDAASYIGEVFGTPNTEGSSGESSGAQPAKPEFVREMDQLPWQFEINRGSASGGTEPY